MWKHEDESTMKPASSPVPSDPPRTVKAEMEPPTKTSMAHVGKSVQIKGELTASEDLHIDGKVEGTIQLREHVLTVGENGRVRASVNARKVIILGSVEGDIRASETVDIRKTGSVVGGLVVAGVSIEEGGYLKGSIDIKRPGDAEASMRNEPKKADSTSRPQKFTPIPPANNAAVAKTL